MGIYHTHTNIFLAVFYYNSFNSLEKVAIQTEKLELLSAYRQSSRCLLFSLYFSKSRFGSAFNYENFRLRKQDFWYFTLFCVTVFFF